MSQCTVFVHIARRFLIHQLVTFVHQLVAFTFRHISFADTSDATENDNRLSPGWKMRGKIPKFVFPRNWSREYPRKFGESQITGIPGWPRLESR